VDDDFEAEQDDDADGVRSVEGRAFDVSREAGVAVLSCKRLLLSFMEEGDTVITLDVDFVPWGGERHHVPTALGSISVVICGDQDKPALLTYPDVGLNCKSFSSSYSSLVCPIFVDQVLLLLKAQQLVGSHHHWMQRAERSAG
jgi:hypothetical protein